MNYDFIEIGTSEPKVLLIEVWLGPLPDYYQFHKETISKQNEIFDIYFFTDQKVDINNLPSNYHVINLSVKELKQRINDLPAEDKAKLEEMKSNPQETIEVLKEVQDEITENLRLNEEIDWKFIIGRAMRYLGLSASLAGLLTWGVACLQGYGMLGAIGGVMLYSVAWVPIVAVVTCVLLGPILITTGASLSGEL